MRRGLKRYVSAPLISQKDFLLSVGISTVPSDEKSGAERALFHNSITVGCWASSGQIPPPALDKS